MDESAEEQTHAAHEPIAADPLQQQLEFVDFIVTDHLGITHFVKLPLLESVAALKRHVRQLVGPKQRVVEFLGLPDIFEGSDEDVHLLQLPLDRPHSILLLCEENPITPPRPAPNIMPYNPVHVKEGDEDDEEDDDDIIMRGFGSSSHENFFQPLDQDGGPVPRVNRDPIFRPTPVDVGVWQENMTQALNMSKHGPCFIEHMQELGVHSFPVPFSGSFEDMLSEAKKSFRIIAVLLHDPEVAESNNFCREALSSDGNASMLETMFLFWASVVDESVKTLLQGSLDVANLPVLAFFSPTGSQFSLINVLAGATDTETLFFTICQVLETHTPILEREKTRREEANLAATLRDQQDEEFQRSLQEDMKKFEEEERQEQLKRHKQDEEARQLEERKRVMEMKRTQLVPEPPAGSAALLLSFKFPDGSNVRRRFPLDTKMQSLFGGEYDLHYPYTPNKIGSLRFRASNWRNPFTVSDTVDFPQKGF